MSGNVTKRWELFEVTMLLYTAITIVEQNFQDAIFYHHVTDKLFIKISGFNVSRGKINMRWFLLPRTSICSGSTLVRVDLKVTKFPSLHLT